jgi:predicted esterase
VINYEKGLAGIDGDATKVFLGGFSQGGQMTTYMQIFGVCL